MPKLHDALVSILMNETALPEYQIEQSGNTVKCHIPSETGKSFKIRVEDTGTVSRGEKVYISANVEMDGSPLRHLSLEGKTSQARTIPGVESSDGSHLLPFYFSNLKVTDEGDCGSSGTSQQVGSIKVTVSWKRHDGFRTVQTVANRHKPRLEAIDCQLEDTAVHEKSKKLTTHRVLLGNPVSLGRSPAGSTYMQLKVKPVNELPTLEFIFHYAYKDLLMARDIIPPTHTAKRTVLGDTANTRKREREEEVSNDVAGLTREEVALLKRLQAKAAQGEQTFQKRIKTEVKTEIKTEINLDTGLPSSKPKVLSNGVIDLTLDD